MCPYDINFNHLMSILIEDDLSVVSTEMVSSPMRSSRSFFKAKDSEWKK